MLVLHVIKKDLEKGLKDIKRFITKGKRNIHDRCQLIVSSNKICLRITGAEIYVNCQSQSTGVFVVYFMDLFGAVVENKNIYPHENIEIIFSKKVVQIKTRQITLLESDYNPYSHQKEIEKPLYSINFVIDLEGQIFQNQTKRYFLKADSSKEFLESKIEADLYKVMHILEKYDVDRNKIEELIKANLIESVQGKLF